MTLIYNINAISTRSIIMGEVRKNYVIFTCVIFYYENINKTKKMSSIILYDAGQQFFLLIFIINISNILRM